MIDPLIDLLKIAAITLIISLFWALSLAVAYGDLQRRRQAGQPVRTLPWMLVVALLPFLGVMIYWTARLVLRPAAQAAQGGSGLEEHRETKLKRPDSLVVPQQITGQEPAPAIYPSFQTVQVSEHTKETIPGRRNAALRNVHEPAAVRHVFTITRGPDQGKQFCPVHFPAQIGREQASHIRIEDDSISRKHALVYIEGGELRIQDQNSRHGTRVNGMVISDQSLLPGDLIEIGLTGLLYQQIGG